MSKLITLDEWEKLDSPKFISQTKVSANGLYKSFWETKEGNKVHTIQHWRGWNNLFTQKEIQEYDKS